jgi:NifU-like protein involved in Fe-S cluster formation
MKLQVKISEDGVVEDVKFRTFGCGSAIASSSYATTWLKGKTIDEAMALKVRNASCFSSSLVSLCLIAAPTSH